MDSSQAREHLESVATIVRNTDRGLHIPAWVFIIWGLFGATINALQQARIAGVELPGDSVLQLPALMLATGLTVVFSLRSGSGRETLIDRQAGTLFSVVFAVMLLASFILQHRVVPYEAMAVLWGLGFAIALIVSGLGASRPLLAGGLALLAACLATAWLPGFFNGLLALGWLCGMVLPGVALARKRG